VSSQPASEDHAAGAVRRRPQWSELGWIGVLVAIGIVQVIRQQWFDAAIYGFMVVMIGADAIGLLPPRARTRSRPLRPMLVAAIACGIGLSIASRHSPVMVAAMLILGVTAVTAAWPGAREPATMWPRGLVRLARAWALCIIGGCVWELGEFVATRIAPHRTADSLSDLANPALSTLVGQAVFATVWLAVGVWLLRRGSRS
jgi:hypothetical protein